MVKLYFELTRNGARAPRKHNPNDACFDIYCWLPFDQDELYIPEGEVKTLKTGFRTAFPPGYKAVIYERGSTGLEGMARRAGIIDAGFRGEWKVGINNTSSRKIIISRNYNEVTEKYNKVYYPYRKAIAQFTLEKIPPTELVETGNLKEKFESVRGEGMKGSTERGGE